MKVGSLLLKSIEARLNGKDSEDADENLCAELGILYPGISDKDGRSVWDEMDEHLNGLVKALKDAGTMLHEF